MSQIWQSKLFSKFPEISHGSAGRGFGLKRVSIIDGKERDKQNYSFVGQLFTDEFQPICVDQIHSGDAINIGQEELAYLKKRNKTLAGTGDALITNQAKAALLVRTADCVPVLMYSPQKGVVAAAHAGWQGTSKKIVQELINLMKNEYNVDSSDIYAVIAPAIGACHYDVSQAKDNRVEIFENMFENNPKVLVREGDKVALDLKEANRILCLEIGVPSEQIELSEICTFEADEGWPSHRREGEDREEFIYSYIAIL